MSVIMNRNGRPILLAMVQGIQDNKQYLGDIDGMIGDGDHGMNMNKGFSIYRDELGDKETTLSDGLFDLGSTLLNKIGGSMGPIYGTIFMDMSEQENNEEKITLELFADMIQAGLKGLEGIVDAQVGDKTLIDTLAPACNALYSDALNNAEFADALDHMKEAAIKGRDSTRNLVAKFGRAARLGERSRGVLDAGATSCCIILESMADSMKLNLE